MTTAAQTPPDNPYVEAPETDFSPVEELDEDPVSTSVPKSVHSSQTFNSAPSILTRFGFAVSVPHISHWTIPTFGHPRA